ncbi:class I SAM-dependent DNA methyltransferase [Acinetobacter indicus]|uniref:class I SAM-dependent DNA methyltransferase n=1 Tax=Acinetobacter indicus TaxID=756892 RepID=UPI001443CA65|nr:class I SAM-dependent DNA methyltransferase [Acinetobacter indicus]
MNAVEIEAAVSELAEKPFDAQEFAFDFLRAFGNKETTIKKLRAGQSNSSDIQNGVLQRNHIHIAVCDQDKVSEALKALRESKATEKAKAKFVLATDGLNLQAEDLISGETISSEFSKFAEHFGFFLPLAGISTIREIKDNPIDVRATGRLNKLYIELLKENPDWAIEERRQDMNHFMARLIFCFFAEDTEIFQPSGIFTQTIEQMSERDSSNTHEVISTLFHAMNVDFSERESTKLPVWAKRFPYVNGGLFSGGTEVPKFSKIARTYLLHAGELNWQKINPDIFGSMIQAVTNDDERGSLGMHYTSVPNILKVLNPLFLDDLNEQLEASKESPLKLLNLRKRIARIRVFDPACGSGNFLVIAYKELRKIEAQINKLRNEEGRATDIPLTNFRGIEINSFPAEIARLALVIAEYQSNVQYCGQIEALQTVLPLSKENWIICGNALRLDWLSICPPTGNTVKVVADDLFKTPLEQTEIDFENEGGETYICGNPPYKGSKWQSDDQKNDLIHAWRIHPKLSKTTDYVSGWIAKLLDYIDTEVGAIGSFVATNSICQGQQATEIWPAVNSRNCEIRFAHTSFQWKNLASNNAGVTVVIVGIGKKSTSTKKLVQDSLIKQCKIISPYLIPDIDGYVDKANKPISEQSVMLFGNMPRDGGNLFLDSSLAKEIMMNDPIAKNYIKRFVGSEELINGKQRYCIWIEDNEAEIAVKSNFIEERLKKVEANRTASSAESTRQFAKLPHRFVQIAGRAMKNVIVVPRVSSENREYLPVDYLSSNYIIGDRNFALYDSPLWNMALIASKLHWIWIATVCVRMRTDFSYSNTLGWNTFPVPKLTEKNKADLTRCAENILLAREVHFPATIADLYDPEKMPENLRLAHEENDEVLERIYIGRRFKNDTERLEKLFSMYTEMTAKRVGKK